MARSTCSCGDRGTASRTLDNGSQPLSRRRELAGAGIRPHIMVKVGKAEAGDETMLRSVCPGRAKARVAEDGPSRAQVHWVTTLAMAAATALAITIFALSHAVAQTPV